MTAPRVRVEDILDPKYVTGFQAAVMLGIAEKTWHNKICSGEVEFEPFGQLHVSGRRSKMIWLRSDVENMVVSRWREARVAR